MLMSRIISKNYTKHSIAKCGFNIFTEVNCFVKLRNIGSVSLCKKIRTSSSKCVYARKNYSIGRSPSHGYCSVQSAIFPNKEDEAHTRSCFQEMMHARKTEAHRSVLIAIEDKTDIPSVMTCFEKYGSIANIYSYPGEKDNCFLLVEFSSETSVQNLLLNCGFKSIDDVFPVSSRIIQYEKKSDNVPTNGKNFKMNIKEEKCSELFFKAGINISEIIEKMYLNEKLTDLDIRLRFFLCSLVKDSIHSLFPYCDVLPFGSSVNGVGKRGCDLDMVIRLYPDKPNGDGEFYFLCKASDGKQKNLQQRTLSRLGDYLLFSPGMSIMEKIMFARVPILKMKHKLLNIDFDVSVNNMSAVLMSDMLCFYGEIDPRIRPLVHVVKKWAKESCITLDRPGSQISNFGLTSLVLFFLQTRTPHPILPPLNDAFLILGSENSYDFRLQCLKPLDDWKKLASLNKDSLAMLLKEFLMFLSSYPFHENFVSLMTFETRPRSMDQAPLYVEYPLDESMNVTKNVSRAEYDAMREKARVSAKYLENNFNLTVKSEKEFSVLLGIPTVSRIGIKSNKFDVKSVLGNGRNSQNRNVKYRTA